MSERVKLGHLIDENGNEVPFFKPNGCGCSDMTDRCIHLGGKYNDDCIISELVAKHGMCCCSDTGVSFYVEKPTPTLAEQVQGWLEAGEYVVMQSYSGDDVGWVCYAHEDRAQLYAVYPCKVAIATHNITHVCNNNPTILHHGDALSTIKWLCEQGYEVEYSDDDNEKRPRTATSISNGRIIGRYHDGESFNWDAETHLCGMKITRFYRPKVETDAEKIERLLREGFTVETRTPGIGLIVTVPDGNCSHTSYYLDGTGEFCEDSLILDDETYLAHYREPEPEDVLRKMDELDSLRAVDVFGPSSMFNPQEVWNRLSDYYAIARWQLITENPENNVSLD